MTSLKTSIKTITYLSDIGCLEIQGASLVSNEITQTVNKKLENQSAAIQQIQKVQVDTNNNLNSMWAVKLQQMQDGRLYIAGIGAGSKRLVRTVLIFTESSDQLSRATDRVPGLPASPGYVQ
ncbi:hypothetical protein ECDEC13D_0967 [Escherichia coli DEC13D]|nr:hypothetical protein ECDEC13D_0967 [Escherichia coli DEC13D]